MDGNSFGESTTQIKFERGLTHINLFAMGIKCLLILIKTFIFRECFNTICKKIDHVKIMKILRPI